MLCENGLATGMVPSQKFALKSCVETGWPLKWSRHTKVKRDGLATKVDPRGLNLHTTG